MPVALNLYEIRKAKGRDGDFFRAMQKQRPDLYQGVYIVGPTGNVLSGHGQMIEPKSKWTTAIRDTLAVGLERFGPVKAREELRSDAQRDRGVGVRDDGSIAIAAYMRYMMLGLDRRGLGEQAAIDRIILTRDDLSKLVIASEFPAGTRWKLPVETVTKFHKLLSPSSDANTLTRADEVAEAVLEVQIDKIADGVAYLSMRGKLAGAHTWQFDPHKGKKIRAEVTLIGVGSVDTKSSQLIELTLVGDGRYWSFPPHDGLMKYGTVAEWRRK